MKKCFRVTRRGSSISKHQNLEELKTNSPSSANTKLFSLISHRKLNRQRHLSKPMASNMTNKLKTLRFYWELRAVPPKSKYIPNLQYFLRPMYKSLRKENTSKIRLLCTIFWKNFEKVSLWVYLGNSMRRRWNCYHPCLQKPQRILEKTQTVEFKFSCLLALLISCRKIVTISAFASGHWCGTMGIYECTQTIDDWRTGVRSI